jgi:S1-C subfamily serine protease
MNYEKDPNDERRTTMETWPPTDPTTDVARVPQRPGKRRGIRLKFGIAVASALALAGIAAGATAVVNDDTVTAANTAEVAEQPSLGDDGSETQTQDSGAPLENAGVPHERDSGLGARDTVPGNNDGPSALASSTQEDAATAIGSESTGLVLIETVLGYERASAAGTGVVLTSDGLILTNNHVIESSTDISVTVAETGETYSATVVGTDVDDDVALLQLSGASGLTIANLDDDGNAAVGDTITAVGNASGGGVLMAADGFITELDSSVTTSSDDTVQGETLDQMIEFEADVVAGDSGGALLDDEGEVVGITTAASSGLATTVAYAIPIEDSLSIVQQILAGDETGGVQTGYPAFLGVAIGGESVAGSVPGRSSGEVSTVAGAQIAYVYSETPAASAGLEAGDTVTAIDGTAVASGAALSTAIAGFEPGDSVTLTWTDTSGATQTGTVTLTEGAAR